MRKMGLRIGRAKATTGYLPVIDDGLDRFM
jgi:hypothetical protein